jgi:hypothetical protein
LSREPSSCQKVRFRIFPGSEHPLTGLEGNGIYGLTSDPSYGGGTGLTIDMAYETLEPLLDSRITPVEKLLCQVCLTSPDDHVTFKGA